MGVQDVWSFYVVILGALMGSFANVVILRLPKGMSFIRPRSYCYKCQKMISWFDNIPVFSWLLLRGKCRSCQVRISWRYPLVELVTALLFWLIYERVGLSWILLEYYYFAFALVVASTIDLDQMILPDKLTLSGIVIGLVGAFLNPERVFFDAVWGVLLGGGFLWAIAYVYWLLRKQEGMGGGDIKLLAWIGAILGWKAIPFVILVSSVIGSVVGLLWSLRSSEGLKKAIPFGPYLALAALLYLLGGKYWGNIYVGFFIPGL